MTNIKTSFRWEPIAVSTDGSIPYTPNPSEALEIDKLVLRCAMGSTAGAVGLRHEIYGWFEIATGFVPILVDTIPNIETIATLGKYVYPIELYSLKFGGIGGLGIRQLQTGGPAPTDVEVYAQHW